MSVHGINDPKRFNELSRPSANIQDECAKKKVRQCRKTGCSFYVSCPLTVLADANAKGGGHPWGTQYDTLGLSNTNPDRPAKTT